MPFSSLLFLHAFLPVFALAYWVTPKRLGNYTALLGSLLFYAWGAPRFLPVLIAFSWADYWVGNALARWRAVEHTRARARWCLGAAVAGHLLMLGYFKYANFFAGELNAVRTALGGTAWAWEPVVLPIGISFITFEAISYLVDVYRGDAKPARRWVDYALFLTLFPHAISGPIFRWKDLDAQLTERSATIAGIRRGCERFVMGLAKKVLLADSVALCADAVFKLPHEQLGPATAWLGACAYALQIYFDFSGYSDMAIGLGAMMGFTFKENFRQPYISETLTEFWQRWHISLSSWLRDYLYIPLGGNRAGERRALLNVFVVFAASGLWHGAAWTFLAWGAFHGAFVVAERAFAGPRKRLAPWAGHVLTMLLVVVGWVFFRADSVHHAWAFLGAMFGRPPTQELSTMPGLIFPSIARAAMLVGVAITMLPRWVPALRMQGTPESPRWLQLVYPLLFAWCSIHLIGTGTTPLIYFKF